MKTKIFLLRHGESLGNANRVLLGHTDWDLSPLGYAQAEATAKHLAKEKIDEIHTSPLVRAYNTAAFHANLRGLELIINDGLREVCIGDWEGMAVSEIKERYGDMYDSAWRGGFGTFAFPGGEEVWSAGERFFRTVTEIAERAAGRTLLISSHAAVIRVFVAMVTKVPREEVVTRLPFPSNASYSVISYENGAFCLEKYSEDKHLEEVGVTKVNY